MARIRSIKPEFWSSPDLPSDPWARLLFVAMWNWADDSGIGVANPRELLGFAFPNDPDLDSADIRRMLVEIRRVFGVKFYTVAGRPYYSIPSWEKHQKFDRRSKGKYPGPDDAETWLYQDKQTNSAESHESTSSPRRDSVAGTGEQGNRGTGEEKTSPPKSAEADEFNQFWNLYPRKEGKKTARQKFKQARKHATLDEILEGVHRYLTALPPDRTKIKMAEGWLNGERWNDPVSSSPAAPGAWTPPPGSPLSYVEM